METSSFDIHQQITDKIVAAIEAGAGTFQMPWHQAGSTQWPVNATTAKSYRGVNVLMLWATALETDYPTAQWATFKQWRERGAQVRKGEKGSLIVFYKTLELKDEAKDDKTQTIPFAKPSWVFNAAQVDGFKDDSIVTSVSEFERLAGVERAIKATLANITYGGSKARYMRDRDEIHMPEASSFIGSATTSPREAFYSTALHELTHWTGAPSRLNREKGKKFADRAYCFEELIAELGAAFLCVRLGITTTPRPDHAQYIAQYLKVLKDDKRAIFAAAAAAASAADFILDFSKPVSTQEAA